MSAQPSLFIGSSSESLEYACALQRVLDDDLVTTVWTHGVFHPGGNTLTSLLERAETTDFAAIFLTPDDESFVRGEYLRTPRDNLLFELGLFIGRIGPERTFLLHPRERVDLPSDLQGITSLSYRTDRPDADAENALGPAATGIRNASRRFGRRPSAPPPAPGPGQARVPAREMLLTIARLGVAVENAGATLNVRTGDGSLIEIVVTDKTRLGMAVTADVANAAHALIVDHLIERLAS